MAETAGSLWGHRNVFCRQTVQDIFSVLPLKSSRLDDAGFSSERKILMAA